MRGVRGIAALAGVMLLAAPAVAHAQEPGGTVRAGAAAVDASWHVGASAGQYASDGTFIDHESQTLDPTAHSTRRRPSYGIQSRLQVRALVVEGPDGERVAIAKTDLYIPQDLVYRRAAQLMEEDDCGIDAEHFTMAVTHNHSSPFYSSTSWGVWTFQDVFDVRFFNYMAERMAEAVRRACEDLVPVRVGASVGYLDKTARHSFGPALADDGTPAGYPNSETDHDLTVVRFDDISDPANPRPLANLVNFSLHPEFLEGNDLISADYLGPLERMADRETRALTIWTQGAVGTAEPERSTYHSIHERLEFTHKDYGQAEYGARLMADEIVDTWRDIERGTPEEEARFVPFDSGFAVEIRDAWYPGPFSHPYPGVSNCRSDKGLAGDPQLPIVGLPDCNGLDEALGNLSDAIGGPDVPGFMPIVDPGLSTDDFQALGIPVPENYTAPAYTGLHEDIDVHLQGIRFGEIYLPVCSCEQWKDQSENIETRTDRVAGNEWVGYDWGERCTLVSGTHLPDGSGDALWRCPNPFDESQSLEVGDAEYSRMRAQVNNPANGWNDLEHVHEAESEPVDPRQIKGNFTHDDRCGPTAYTPGDEPCSDPSQSASANLGYTLTVPIAMANDYNGYIASYREYQRGDHYRKALTGWGPHSSDYMASRLVAIGRLLNAPAGVAATDILPTDQEQEQPLAAKAELDTQLNEIRAAALGEVGGAAIEAYEARLPGDGGEPRAVEQPDDVQRFGAAFFTWIGGSNYTDSPRVRVQRRVNGSWRNFADQSGEVPVTLEFPAAGDLPPYLSGEHEWRWTAHFEAFVSPFDTGAPGEGARATPVGTYRFVVEGQRREGGAVVPYRVVSTRFAVRPWVGITVEDLRLEPDNRVSFRIGPRSTYAVKERPDIDAGDVAVVGAGPTIEAEIGPIDYPDSYRSPARFIRELRTAYRDPQAPADPARLEWFCFTCTFRPWLAAGDARRAELTVAGPDGATGTIGALHSGDRWVSERPLEPGETAYVKRGGVQDRWGNFNGRRSEAVSRPQ
jgi:hypothetical protein